jgi:4-hydroxythreonine-4-phosphate dehydrogenase
MQPSDSGLLVISCGDPGGIGGEILWKALASGATSLPVLLALPVTLAHEWLLAHGAPPFLLPAVHPADLRGTGGFWCLPDEPGWPGDVLPLRHEPCVTGGQLAWTSLERAVDLVMQQSGRRALVTAPIHKQAMSMAGFRWPGHTEYLEERGGAGAGLMLMHSPRLSVGLVTNHLPLARVADAIDRGLLEHKIRLCCRFLALQGLEGELTVLGLDPHCGDGGAIGHTDTRLVAPLVEHLRAEGLPVRGPVPADAALARGHGRYLAMYHDQGLPVFKLVAGGDGVNTTLGLPFVRVSPDHGTAFDIAGRGLADPASMASALGCATRLLNRPAGDHPLETR